MLLLELKTLINGLMMFEQFTKFLVNFHKYTTVGEQITFRRLVFFKKVKTPYVFPLKIFSNTLHSSRVGSRLPIFHSNCIVSFEKLDGLYNSLSRVFLCIFLTGYILYNYFVNVSVSTH